MKITSSSISELPFSKLFKDYISNFGQLSDFFDSDPFSEKDTGEKLKSFSFLGDRDQSVQLLKNFNHRYGAGEEVYESIDKFKNKDSCAIVTGQQLTIYGGPLYTVLKIITAIHYSVIWEKKFGRPFIPVFWMADEDHDFDEAASIGLPYRDDFVKVSIQSDQKKQARVSDIPLDKNLRSFREEVKKHLPETDFSDQLWKLLDDIYREGNLFSEGFAKLILKIFGKYGLILAGTNDKKIKKLITVPICQSIEKSSKAYTVLRKQSDKLEAKGYHSQVLVQPSNLFWIDDQANREKISNNGHTWHIDGKGTRWSQKELINAVNKSPERFSPNVFLRPITQSYFLPCIAYVAGPAEVAYYAQMKDFYSLFGLKMPIIIPRFSATIVESGIDRIIDKLPFEKHLYNRRIEDLESEYIAAADIPDIESIFQNWKITAEAVSADTIRAISEIDPTLEGSANKVNTGYFNELDKLKGKVYRSLKDQEKTQLNRLRRIQNSLFPDGNLQEREVACIYFMNKYGQDIWSQLLHELADDTPNSHKWIYL